MKKKLPIIIGVVVVAAVVIGYLSMRNPESDHAVTKVDTTTGQSTYTNLDYGFSITYGKDWEGPAETKDANAKPADPLTINAIFQSTSTLEVIVIGGKPGDTESFNDFAASLDSSRVVTVGGLPALQYEYVAPINEQASAYAKGVMLVFKQLPKGSVTLAYQRIFKTEKEAKAADLTRFNEFLTHIMFK